MSLTQSRLKELLDYNPDTGVFVWREWRGGTAFKGSVAGRPDSKGRIQVMVDGASYFAHRLAWLFVNGKFPPEHIDHINRDVSDNRIQNLRLASNIENGQNRNKHPRNTSGVSGVSFHKKTGKWQAKITFSGKTIYLGVYESIEEAAAARAFGKEKYHKFHPIDNP